MKTNIKEPVDYDYDEVVSLACQIWQEEGCQFGRYQICWQQAKNHFLAARPHRSAKAGRRGKSL